MIQITRMEQVFNRLTVKKLTLQMTPNVNNGILWTVVSCRRKIKFVHAPQQNSTKTRIHRERY